MNGAELIAAERQRQISQEGWTHDHDDEHREGELISAAMAYVERANVDPWASAPVVWPWASSWWKPSDDPIRNLAKAGALIAAEIDRLQRISSGGLNPAKAIAASHFSPPDDPPGFRRQVWL